MPEPNLQQDMVELEGYFNALNDFLDKGELSNEKMKSLWEEVGKRALLPRDKYIILLNNVVLLKLYYGKFLLTLNRVLGHRDDILHPDVLSLIAFREKTKQAHISDFYDFLYVLIQQGKTFEETKDYLKIDYNKEIYDCLLVGQKIRRQRPITEELRKEDEEVILGALPLREKQVYELLKEDKKRRYEDVARLLKLSPTTIALYVSRLRSRLPVQLLGHLIREREEVKDKSLGE